MREYRITASLEKFGKGLGVKKFTTRAVSPAKAICNARFQAWGEFGRATVLKNIKVEPDSAAKQVALF